jgi:hypothetical protein
MSTICFRDLPRLACSCFVTATGVSRFLPDSWGTRCSAPRLACQGERTRSTISENNGSGSQTSIIDGDAAPCGSPAAATSCPFWKAPFCQSSLTASQVARVVSRMRISGGEVEKSGGIVSNYIHKYRLHLPGLSSC